MRVANEIPPLLRLLCSADRVAHRAAEAVTAAVEQIALATVHPCHRDQITAQIYAQQRTYAPGGNIFQTGLFSWERAAIEVPPFPQHGRVLVAAAGGGREAFALRKLGYDVVAFDACDQLCAAARQSDTHVDVIHATFHDLIKLPACHPLTHAVQTPFDAVLVGWTGLSHVMSHFDLAQLLRAFLRLAPGGPVLVSYHARPDLPLPMPTSAWLKRWGYPSSPADRFRPWIGFHVALSISDLQRASAEAGYELAWVRQQPTDHALLVPTSPMADRDSTPSQG